MSVNANERLRISYKSDKTQSSLRLKGSALGRVRLQQALRCASIIRAQDYLLLESYISSSVFLSNKPTTPDHGIGGAIQII
jgi:hypothetical protein